MTVHGRITQRAVKPTTDDSPLYIPLKDEHDHGVHEPESPEERGGCEPLRYMAGPMSKQHRSFHTHRRYPSGFLLSPLESESTRHLAADIPFFEGQVDHRPRGKSRRVISSLTSTFPSPPPSNGRCKETRKGLHEGGRPAHS